MVCFLMLVEIEFKLVFLVLNQFLGFCQLWSLLALLVSYFDIVKDLQVIIEDLPLVQNFSLD